MTGLDEFPNIGVHKGDLHGDIYTIREYSVEVCPPPLDEAEDVIPPPTVEATRVFS